MSSTGLAVVEPVTDPEAEWHVLTDFVRYDLATGAIVEAGTQSVGAIRMLAKTLAGSAYLALDAASGLTPDGHLRRCGTHFVDLAGPTLKAKGPCPAVLDGLVLSRLPTPCKIEISNPAGAPSVYDWTSDALELSFEHPGSYRVRVLSVPFLPGEFEVTAAG